MADARLMERVLRIEAETKAEVEARAKAAEEAASRSVEELATACAQRAVDKALHAVAQRSFEASVGIASLEPSFEAVRAFDLSCTCARTSGTSGPIAGGAVSAIRA